MKTVVYSPLYKAGIHLGRWGRNRTCNLRL